MWKKNKRAGIELARIDTLVAANVVIQGDIHYRGGIQIDGTVKGNIIAEDDDDQTLVRITSNGHVEGNLYGPNVIINGKVDGNVCSTQHLELAQNASVTGNVHYNLMEMVIGSEVNGQLVHDVAPRPEALHSDLDEDDVLDTLNKDIPAGVILAENQNNSGAGSQYNSAS